MLSSPAAVPVVTGLMLSVVPEEELCGRILVLARQLAAPVLNRDGCAHRRERRPPHHKTLDGALQASTETSVTLVEGLFCQFLLLSPFRSSPPQKSNTRGTRRGVTRSDQLLV